MPDVDWQLTPDGTYHMDDDSNDMADFEESSFTSTSNIYEPVVHFKAIKDFDGFDVI